MLATGFLTFLWSLIVIFFMVVYFLMLFSIIVDVFRRHDIHGGLGGPQTRPFVLHPAELPAPDGAIVGAATVHGLLAGWRRTLQGDDAIPLRPAVAAANEVRDGTDPVPETVSR